MNYLKQDVVYRHGNGGFIQHQALANQREQVVWSQGI